MNDNYLWDRSGEPDPEVQELEEILGTLRYQPRPLEIPANIRVAKKRNYVPLAIAASIAIMVIGAALWFQLSRSQSAPGIQANSESKIGPSEKQAAPVEPPKQLATAGGTEESGPRPEPKKMLVASHKHRETRVPRQPAFTPEELAEKEQVLTALRLVSAKLNLAQRKVQGLPQRNIFRNQNKIG